MRFLAKMCEALKWLILWLVAGFVACAIVLIVTPEARAAKYEVTYYAISEHFTAKKHNQYSHHFIGVEMEGWSIATYKNSYYKRSVLVGYTKYWQVAEYWQASIMLGAVSGYKDQGQSSCPYICPVLAPGITYTKYDQFRPRLSIMGAALTLSFSFKF